MIELHLKFKTAPLQQRDFPLCPIEVFRRPTGIVRRFDIGLKADHGGRIGYLQTIAARTVGSGCDVIVKPLCDTPQRGPKRLRFRMKIESARFATGSCVPMQPDSVRHGTCQ